LMSRIIGQLTFLPTVLGLFVHPGVFDLLARYP
jgi:hypothetical protein